MTAECLALYVESLSDLSDDQFTICVGRAMKESHWFPKPAVLREFVMPKAEDVRQVEADAAWRYANEYLQKWGVDRMPLCSGGKRIEAPRIRERVDYALRRIGGLPGLNRVTTESRPFVRKDFIEAYNLAPLAESLSPQLIEKFGDTNLLGEVKQLAGEKRLAPEHNPHLATKPVVSATVKKAPEPTTDAQRRDRREMLLQQRREIDSRRSPAPQTMHEELPQNACAAEKLSGEDPGRLTRQDLTLKPVLIGKGQK
jgi:hypothetical protein